MYNNIDLDNIFVESNLSLNLMNFECMTKPGQPINLKNCSSITFKSVKLLEDSKTSTFKDDIISIFYLLIFLLCGLKHIKMNLYLLK